MRAKATRKQALQEGSLAFLSAFLPAFLSAFLSALLPAFLESEAFCRGDVRHDDLPFQCVDFLQQPLLQICRQPHQPVDDPEQIDDALLVPIAFVEQLGQPPFCRIALFRVTLGAPGKKVSRGDQCEGVGVFEQGFGLVGVVQELDHGKADADLAAEQLIAKPVRLPVFTFVGQHGQAGNRTAVAVVEAVVVGKQALGKVGIVLTLDFDVDVNPLLTMCQSMAS